MLIILKKQQSTHFMIQNFKLPFTQRNFQDNRLRFHLSSAVSWNFALTKKIISQIKVFKNFIENTRKQKLR